jgi:hypothetical protein
MILSFKFSNKNLIRISNVSQAQYTMQKTYALRLGRFHPFIGHKGL